ncbi:MAG: 30S ribosomal protein S17 [Candidatus Levybacteria bacterium]|nr:30S ribosomal protein S17 [Candidatus Levybacteria bacterium]
MQKTLSGKIVSVKGQDTVVIEVTRKVAHPMYKKLMKKTKTFKADSKGQTFNLGDKVKIISVRPISKDKFFKVMGVIK